MDHEEEQATEIEALESIYYDSFTVVSEKPHCFEIIITSEDDNESKLSVKLQFTFTPTYPEEAPLYEILDCEGVEEDDERLSEIINSEIESSLGMPMVFSIASAIQEHMNGIIDEAKRKEEEEKIRKEKALEEEEQKKFHGTPVTVETFLGWKLKFDEEMKVLKQLKEKSAEKQKPTGKELFLSDKSLLENEILEGEKAGVTIDESLFEDLDDLELEDDPDFDPNDYS